ncbi:polyketide cyclase [Pedobacter lusitanus]|uniref:Polyketide cyclase n=1 Tax=Pedobacter lusitanus TaxID=1503925 RepID=A0A0D0FX76_9SPHI|nr:SRPBCC family protein [Pedobacter lusitanus]KIO77119.1 polyketide cyclase [Pedobacter lusitanus]
MKIIKTILTILVLLIVIVLVVAAFMKKDYSVERDVTIKKPKQEVFAYLVLLKNHNNFTKWASMDPKMKQEFKGTDGTVGFTSSWDSNMENVGKGEQTISKINDGERIDYNLHFIKPFDANATAYLETTAPSANQTKVRWVFEGKMNYPMNIMCLFMNMDKSLGADLQTGLDNLKNVLEKQ